MFGGFYFQKNSIFNVENTDPQKEREKVMVTIPRLHNFLYLAQYDHSYIYIFFNIKLSCIE